MITRKKPRGKCPLCGKAVVVRSPTGDYLDALFPIRHNAPGGVRCDGHLHEIETKDLIK